MKSIPDLPRVKLLYIPWTYVHKLGQDLHGKSVRSWGLVSIDSCSIARYFGPLLGSKRAQLLRGGDAVIVENPPHTARLVQRYPASVRTNYRNTARWATRFAQILAASCKPCNRIYLHIYCKSIAYDSSYRRAVYIHSKTEIYFAWIQKFTLLWSKLNFIKLCCVCILLPGTKFKFDVELSFI